MCVGVGLAVGVELGVRVAGIGVAVGEVVNVVVGSGVSVGPGGSKPVTAWHPIMVRARVRRMKVRNRIFVMGCTGGYRAQAASAG